MTAALLPLEPLEPDRKRRESPQPEVPGRLPLHEPCGFLRDSVGHVWACLAPRRRPR